MVRTAIGFLVGLVAEVSVAAEPHLEGRVRLESGEPAVGAQVLIFDLADLRGAPVTATTDRSGRFTLPLASLAWSPARTVRAGSELSQPVQSLHDDSLPAVERDVRAAGGLQPPGTAGGDPGGRGATGRFPHGELGRHRCGRAGGGRRGLSLPPQRRRGAGHPVDAADRRTGGDAVGWRRVDRRGR